MATASDTNGSSRGRGEPSPLTVARIDHEIMGLKELLTAKDAVVGARLSAMDKAVQLLEKFPTAIDIIQPIINQFL